MVRFRRMEKVHAYVGSTCYSPPDCRHHCRSRVRSHEEWVIARTFNLRASRCRKGRGVVHHPSLSLFPVRHRHPRLQTWQAPLFHALSSVSSVSFPPTHPAGSVRLPTVPRTALPPSPSLSLQLFLPLPSILVSCNTITSCVAPSFGSREETTACLDQWGETVYVLPGTTMNLPRRVGSCPLVPTKSQARDPGKDRPHSLLKIRHPEFDPRSRSCPDT